jgi:sporulation protein YlmC with PRC-barrel domain
LGLLCFLENTSTAVAKNDSDLGIVLLNLKNKPMKLPSLLISSILVATCCVQAKDTPKPHELEYRDTEKFTRLIGLEIRNLQDEKLGKVKFITVDLENARLVEIVVTTTGGVWGLGTKITAVPPRACILDEEKNVMRIDTT